MSGRIFTASGGRTLTGAAVFVPMVWIFLSGKARSWRRSLEEHREKAWEVEELKRFLTEAGFGRIRVWGDCCLRAPRQDEQRIYFSCIRE